MSVNSTMPLIRPPSDGSQNRRAAMAQNGATAVSPFANVMAQQESLGRGAQNPAVPVGGSGSGSAGGFNPALGPFSAVMAANSQGAPVAVTTVPKGGLQGQMLERRAGDRSIPPMLGREIGMAPAQSGGQNGVLAGAQTGGQNGVQATLKLGGTAVTRGNDRPIPPMLSDLSQNALPEISRTTLARANLMARVNIDKQRTQALENFSQNMGGDSPLDMARNAVTTRNLRTVVGGFALRAPVMPMSDSIKSQAMQSAQRSGRAGKGQHDVDSAGIGKLAAQFESGSDGVAAIGYDRVGGTSYGKYQIASRVGSLDGFLKFLDTAAPDMAKELRASGPANTGSRKGAMPDTWRKLAAEQPERFEALQEKFIYDSHYKPALEAVAARTPLDEDRISSVMQEVLWSTAVQHGPAGAARIFTRAAEGAGKATDKNYDKKVINNVYAIRAEQFGSSTEQVQESVRNRMHKEKKLALNMLEHQGKVA